MDSENDLAEVEVRLCKNYLFYLPERKNVADAVHVMQYARKMQYL